MEASSPREPADGSRRVYLWWGVGLGLLLVLWLVSWLVVNRPWESPEEVLRKFYAQPGPEETLMDPLILAGKKVVPLVVREIQNKEMPSRRYAIGFLGNGSYRAAIPVLETILGDGREKDYFRADALLSLYQIDTSLGLGHAQEYAGRQDFLGDMARQILAGAPFVRKRRTYFAAWTGGRQR